MPNALERMERASRLNRPIIHVDRYPVVAILHSKMAGNTAYEAILFEDQETLRSTKGKTVAQLVVINKVEDLKAVPNAVLDRIIAERISRQDRPATETETGGDPLSLVFDALPGVSTPFKESTMADQTEGTTATDGGAKTKAEAQAAERKAAREKKAAEKEAAKKARIEARGNGVIGTIKKALDTKAGTTQEEVLDELVKKFPDRTREGMSSTVKIQFSRLAKSTGRAIHNAAIEGRGRVYKFEDQGPVPGKVVEPAAKAPETPAEPKAPATPAAAAPAATEAPKAAATKPAAKTGGKGK